MLSPFFSTRHLWTTEPTKKRVFIPTLHAFDTQRSFKAVACEIPGEVHAAVGVHPSFCQAACSLPRWYLPNRTAQRVFQRAGRALRGANARKDSWSLLLFISCGGEDASRLTIRVRLKGLNVPPARQLPSLLLPLLMSNDTSVSCRQRRQTSHFPVSR